MKTIRYLATALFAALLFTIIVGSGVVQAGSISRGGSSFGSARSTPAPARSIGTQRPTSVAPAPRPAAATAPTPQRYGSVTQPQAPNLTTAGVSHAPSGGGGGSNGGFWSSFAGGAAGAVVGNALTQPHGATTVVTAPAGGAVSAAPAAYASPAVVTSSSSSFGFLRGMLDFTLGLVVLAVAIVGGMILWQRWQRRQTAQQRLDAAAAEPVTFYPGRLFYEVQQAFAQKDRDALIRLLSPNLLDEALNDLPALAGDHTMRNVSAMLIDSDETTRTVRYVADDIEDGTKLNEVWHWVAIDRQWRLDGIQQHANP